MKDTRVRNWSEYNKALVQRGNITLWLDETLFNKVPSKSSQRGRPKQYQDALIEACLLLKNVFHLTFRKLEGFLISLIKQGVPNYTTLCRRQHGVSSKLYTELKKAPGSPLDLVVNSTGLKIYGEGEWCVKKHGKQYQRTWRKVHLAVDAGTLEIVGCELTTSRVQDGLVLERLLKKVSSPIRQVIGDGAYDKFCCYEAVVQRGGQGLFPPQTGARLSSETKHHKKAAGQQALQDRDKIINATRSIGKKAWKEAAGYHKRSLAETTMYRLKQLLGNRLRAKKTSNQELEIRLRCKILNKMIEWGRPERRAS